MKTTKKTNTKTTKTTTTKKPTQNNLEDKVKLVLEDPNKYASNTPLDQLVELLRELSHNYYNTDTPLVTDDVYDIMYNILKQRDPNNSYLSEIGGPISKDMVQLPYPMASLNKVREDVPLLNNLDKWINTYKGPYVVSDKLDGVSGLLHKKNNKYKLYTRGNSNFGQDITHLVPYLFQYDLSKIPDDVAIRGEIIMKKSVFADNKKILKDKSGKEYKNIRNTIAGLVNSKTINTDLAKLTEFVAYTIVNPQYKQSEQMKKLTEWGVNSVQYKIFNKLTYKLLDDYIIDRKENSEYDIDGLVIIDNEKAYNITDQNPDHGIAFKKLLDSQIVETTVLSIKWNLSRHGYLTPVVIVKPVELGGVTVKKVTASTADNVVKNNLGPGSKIKITRSGDVIPKIIEILTPSTSGKPQMPTVPYKWNETKVNIILDDIHASANENIIVRTLEHFFNTMEIKSISEGILMKLVSEGYTTLFDILNADKSELQTIEGLGEKTITKIFDNIESAFQNTTLETIMAASSCFDRGMGIKKLKIVVDTYPDILINKWSKTELLEKLLALEGFQSKTAQIFINGLDKFKTFYQNLSKVSYIDLGYLNKIQAQPKPTPKDGIFKNTKIVFTGFRDNQLKDYIINNGGIVNDSVSKNTNILIYNNNTSSSYNKAIQLGIITLTKQEFIDKYNIKL